MSVRSLLLALLYALTIQLVLVLVAAAFLLLAQVLADGGATTVLRWCLGTLVALAAGNVVLLVIALTVDRLLRGPPEPHED